jgi:hypothetical protein
MSRADLSKIERVVSPKNHKLGVDLFLDKRDGKFFADVGGERVSDVTKSGAIEKVRALLAKITVVEWRPVILLRIDESERDEDDVGRENDKRVFTASCSFTYLRRERAVHPLKPKELIEREHIDEFEERVAKERKRVASYEFGVAKKIRADETEKKLRDDRAALSRTEEPYFSHWNNNSVEHELPYSPEVWAGVQRISQALRETQARLNTLVRTATPTSLARLGTGDVFKLLPPAGKKRIK